MGLPREEHNQLVHAIAECGSAAAKQCAAWAEEAGAGKTPDVGAGDAGEYEPGDVPAGVIPALRRYVGSLGYTVAGLNQNTLDQVEGAGVHPLGYTIGAVPPESGVDHPPMQVCVKDGMSSAATVRVLAHEVGHVLLGHASGDPLLTLLRSMRRAARFQEFGDAEDPCEEIPVQLAAGAVCHLAEIGTGEFSTKYMACRMAHPLFLDEDGNNTERACNEALRVAEQVWPVVRDALKS